MRTDQRNPAQLEDGLIPPKTVFRNDIIGLLPEFAGYGVLARFPFARGLPIARRSFGSATLDDTGRETAARRLSAANDCYAPQDLSRQAMRRPPKPDIQIPMRFVRFRRMVLLPSGLSPERNWRA